MKLAELNQICAENTVHLYNFIPKAEAIRFQPKNLVTICTWLGPAFKCVTNGSMVIVNIAGSNKAIETKPTEEGGPLPMALIIENPEDESTTIVTEGQWIVNTIHGYQAMDDEVFQRYYRRYTQEMLDKDIQDLEQKTSEEATKNPDKKTKAKPKTAKKTAAPKNAVEN